MKCRLGDKTRRREGHHLMRKTEGLRSSRELRSKSKAALRKDGREGESEGGKARLKYYSDSAYPG